MSRKPLQGFNPSDLVVDVSPILTAGIVKADETPKTEEIIEKKEDTIPKEQVQEVKKEKVKTVKETSSKSKSKDNEKTPKSVPTPKKDPDPDPDPDPEPDPKPDKKVESFVEGVIVASGMAIQPKVVVVEGDKNSPIEIYTKYRNKGLKKNVTYHIRLEIQDTIRALTTGEESIGYSASELVDILLEQSLKALILKKYGRV